MKSSLILRGILCGFRRIFEVFLKEKWNFSGVVKKKSIQEACKFFEKKKIKFNKTKEDCFVCLDLHEGQNAIRKKMQIVNLNSHPRLGAGRFFQGGVFECK